MSIRTIANNSRRPAQSDGALKDLTDELAARGAAAISERMARVVGRELSPVEVGALTSRWPGELAVAYRDGTWATGSGGVDGDSNGEQTPAPGAWRVDQPSLSLRYQPVGHADPWLTAWLDAVAEAANGPQAELAEPLLREALKPTAAGQCGSCHSVERNAARLLAIQWRAAAAQAEAAQPHATSHTARICCNRSSPIARAATS